MKKIIAILLASMMAATALVGCGGGESSTPDDNSSKADASTTTDSSAFGDEDNISLKVWAPDAAINVFTQQCEDFKALYPDKTISIELVAQTESDAGQQVLNDPEVAADVFAFASDQLPKLQRAGVIAPIAYTEDIKANNSAESVAAATINDTIYAYPETGDNGYFLIYDKSVVSDEQAKTFEGVLQACKDAGKKFRMDAGNGYYACMFAYTGGCLTEGFEEDGITQKFSDYDEDEVVATLQAFATLFHEYSTTFESLSTDNIPSGFANGKCGAGIDGSWDNVSNMEALGDNFGAAKLPTINVNGEDKQIVSMLGYKFIGVNAASSFPRSAQILANYLAGEECQRQRAEELGWGPSNSVVSQEEVVTGNAALAAIAEQGKHAVAQVAIADTFWDPFANLGNKLFATDFDYKDADAVKTLFETTIKNVRDEA